MKKQHFSGQTTTEYALILVFVLMAVVLAVTLFGKQVKNAYQRVDDALEQKSIPSLTADFINRINQYYQSHGSWPSSWGEGRFTQLGLNANDWQKPVSGIVWNPHGNEIGLSNVSGDEFDVYVKDLSGTRLHLVNGWNIWCRASNNICYFHTSGSGTPVDINTVEVVKVP